MAEYDAIIKQNDTWPAIGEVDPVVLEANGVPIPLTGATVKFLARKVDDPATIIEGACDLVSAIDGTVMYQWAVGDTAIAGDYQFEFQITFGDGRVGTAPTDGYKLLKIVDDIAD